MDEDDIDAVFRPDPIYGDTPADQFAVGFGAANDIARIRFERTVMVTETEARDSIYPRILPAVTPSLNEQRHVRSLLDSLSPSTEAPTGASLSGTDYRISDPWVDQPEMTDSTLLPDDLDPNTLMSLSPSRSGKRVRAYVTRSHVGIVVSGSPVRWYDDPTSSVHEWCRRVLGL